jgi:hypothetical protein
VLATGKVTYVIIAHDRWELLPRQLRDRVTVVGATASHKLFRWTAQEGATPAGTPSAAPAGK